jgi:hypothetical protein
MCGTCSIRGRDITVVLYRFENLKGLGHTRDPSVKWTIILELPTRCNLVIEFIEGSICFERNTAHHQELQTVFAASGLYTHVVTGRCMPLETLSRLCGNCSSHIAWTTAGHHMFI